ncbi:benomyl/methotrexate resistance protein [Massariosphaeria phaeospora]|uniref:Benomyl/methotrexate resistance protein n=1 Tax=Massariosphaeria phaeospora TaxID=100035 RepID=A0A7C8I454_9PLEO|nr:benomyl/methotrexate resistance protein [Massariosphaeria phaeospora]
MPSPSRTSERTPSTSSSENNGNLAPNLAIDEEKTIGLNGIAKIVTTEHQQPLTGVTNHTAKSLHSTKSHHSQPHGSSGNGNGTATSTPDETGSQFLVTWDGGDADPLNPRSMTALRRWGICGIIGSSSLCVQLIPEFHTSRMVCTLGLSLFVVGLGTGPMILSPLSEFYGRRPIYLASFTFFLLWMIPCALARNTATLLTARFLDGLAGSAFLSVAGGTVGDMFAKHELSAPMMLYSAAPFVGPEVGPLVGGFIVENTSWRWCFYLLIMWSGFQLALIFLFVPETYHPVLLRQKARRLRKETGNAAWIAPIEKMDRTIAKTVVWSCIRPFQLLFFEPMCLNLCILSAVLLGILYLFFGAFPLVFQNNHGFSIPQVGLSFLGILVGMLVGIASDPIWRRCYDRLVQRREAQGGEAGGSEPEYRLPSTIFGAILVPIALFGKLLQAFDYPLYAASALAANSFARSYFAAAFPLFGVQMYNTLGYQWATTLLAFLALALAP